MPSRVNAVVHSALYGRVAFYARTLIILTPSRSLRTSTQAVDDRRLRQLQIVRLRGPVCVLGLHIFRIDPCRAASVFASLGLAGLARKIPSTRCLSIGIPEWDMLLGGGIPEGDGVLVAGARGREIGFGNPKHC